ncbi:hypothetical protein NPIL_174201 [Nephila pilipes]|uniref:Uncharacterized protein n=1 Tax=Nephila pilipes TaxID=299642 RepID=A0A8X6JXA7_NEPPI|nr:hypothetical protein NPIL_174201 [Nephila pilipes]
MERVPVCSICVKVAETRYLSEKGRGERGERVNWVLIVLGLMNVSCAKGDDWCRECQENRTEAFEMMTVHVCGADHPLHELSLEYNSVEWVIERLLNTSPDALTVVVLGALSRPKFRRGRY